MSQKQEEKRRKHYFGEDGYVSTTIKIPATHREALEVLSRASGEPLSMIIRRLVREELYYRGLIDDELL